MSWYSGLEHIVREAEPLAHLTWFRIGGSAEFFAEPTSIEELSTLVTRCHDHHLSLRILGGGSRVLVSDAGVSGLVIQLSAPVFCEIHIDGDAITAGGGTKLSHLVSTSVRDGLAGLESLVGIPGSVAGALKGNSDANGSSIGQWTDEVAVMTNEGKIRSLAREDLRFSYRQSNLDDPIILRGRFKLEKGDTVELTRRMQTLWIVKRSSTPTADVGHGQIFRDVQGLSAAELLEQAGMRNQRVGNAEVSDLNANIVIAHPGTTTDDVRKLVDLMQNQVESQLGVRLERELQIW